MKSAAQERCCIVPLVIRSIPATSHLNPLSLFLQRREHIYSCLRGQFHSFVPFTALTCSRDNYYLPLFVQLVLNKKKYNEGKFSQEQSLQGGLKYDENKNILLDSS
jgi:hypothetical protein